MYRRHAGILQIFLVHPGGPFWAKKELGAWSIPKGEYAQNEDPLSAAQREFKEETGLQAYGPFIPLKMLKQSSGKIIQAWAFEGDCDPTTVKSNTFLMEWPPRSGKQQEFPEIDRGEWFDIEEAKRNIQPGQAELIAELTQKISECSP